ncbi:hypothetical protein [Peptostreptococcus canis]|uniref:Lipoprotein n=1 Tax=Peptostreptococcus canis TaxID=1159213 RepID=A0ABR6TM76_9FIRM|nr:hypothetical protein [Peptostreptococcus canis]MBC2576499.1 hypothetical protein [Peptostreptococcus canis]MBP1998665.1 hypothetical protein [Peptostreptococcus canis]
MKKITLFIISIAFLLSGVKVCGYWCDKLLIKTETAVFYDININYTSESDKDKVIDSKNESNGDKSADEKNSDDNVDKIESEQLIPEQGVDNSATEHTD